MAIIIPVKVNGKGKGFTVIKHHALKTYRENGGTTES